MGATLISVSVAVISTQLTMIDRQLLSASCTDYVAPRTNRRLADGAFSSAAPSAWNLLPTDLHSASDFNSFSRQLKTFLFFRFYIS